MRGLLPPFLWGPRRENGGLAVAGGEGGTLLFRAKAASWAGTQASGQRVVFTTNSPKSIRYANLHSSHSPIHPNQYANLLLSKVRAECREGGGWCPFVQVGRGAVSSGSDGRRR